jgi:SRSO17 transposase
LAERDLGYIVQVKGTATAHGADAVPELTPARDKGWRGLPRYRTKPVSLREHVLAAGRSSARRLSWRQASKGELAGEFVALRVRPAGRKPRYDDNGTLPLAWLIAQWPPDEAEPVKYWLSNLPDHTPLQDLIRLGKIRWRINTTTANSKPARASTTTKAAPGPAGTATSLLVVTFTGKATLPAPGEHPPTGRSSKPHQNLAPARWTSDMHESPAGGSRVA